MSFFDDFDTEESFNEILPTSTTVCSMTDYPLGSMVTYNTVSKSINYYAPETEECYVRGKGNIPIGVVLEQLDDMSYIILYKGCLNKDTLDLTSIIYNMRGLPNKATRTQYIASVVSGQFKKYST